MRSMKSVLPKDSAEVREQLGHRAIEGLRLEREKNAEWPVPNAAADVSETPPPPPYLDADGVPIEHVPQHEARTLPPPGSPPPEAITFADFVELDERAGLPPFPIGALPGWAADWAIAAAEAEHVPLDIAATLALGAISTCVMGKAKVAIWIEPLNLYLLLIDRSGANKSGIYKAAMRPVEACVARAALEADGELAVWSAKLAAAQGRLKHEITRRSGGGTKPGRGAKVATPEDEVRSAKLEAAKRRLKRAASADDEAAIAAAAQEVQRLRAPTPKVATPEDGVLSAEQLEAAKTEREDAAKAARRNDEDAEADLAAAAQEVQRLEASRPKGGLRFCGDVTPEMFAILLAQNHAVALHSAEGAEVFEALGRYGKGPENMDTMLKAWKCDILRVDRKNGTHLSVPNPLAGMVAMAQPTVLNGLRDREGKREERGALGRFLYCVPRSLVGTRTPTRGRIESNVAEGYRSELERLLALAYPVQVDDELAMPMPMIGVSADAEAIFDSFYAETEGELRPAGDLVDVESFAAKLRSALARIAGVLHLATPSRRFFSETVDGLALGLNTIDAATTNDALAITRYFLAHGKVAHGMMDAGAGAGAALALRLFAKIAELAERGSEAGLLKLRDVVFAAHGAKAFKTAKAREAAVYTLEAAGYVRRVRPDAGERGERLAVNPDALKVWRRRESGVNGVKGG